MLSSLNRLKTLPATTQVFCTHEYTTTNINFALSLEPENQQLQARANAVKQLRNNQQPTLPSNILMELNTNPFLRCSRADIIKNSNAEEQDELSVFTAIRSLRNHY